MTACACRAAVERVSLEVARHFLVEAEAFESIELVILHVQNQKERMAQH